MRKEIILPSLALAGGAVGLVLRKWELATAFELDTGLAMAGMPATWALIVCTLAVLLVLAVLAWGSYSGLVDYDQAFAAKGNTLYMLLMTGAAGLCVLSSVMGFFELPSAWALLVEQAASHGARPSVIVLAPQVALAVLALLSAGSLLLVGRNNYAGQGRGKYNVPLLVPAYSTCVWLIVAYQARSGDPVILDYVWQLFAVICAVLGSYFMAGFAFERPKAFPAVLFCLGGVYFCLVTLGDGHSPSQLLLYGAFLLYLFVSAVALLSNARQTASPRAHSMDLEEPHHDQ